MSDNPHGLVLPPELDPRGRRPARRERGRLARVLSWVAVLTSFAIVATSGVGYALYRYYDGNIDRLPLHIGGNRPARVGGKALNFLLVGSDSRDGLSKEELRKAATEFTPGRRSDTMILIHLAADRKHVTLVSFPRDSYVEIPAHGGKPLRSAKINTAFSDGGPALAIQTVEHLTGVRVDHYLEVNFAGFQRLVDALDGVDVCLPKPAKDSFSGIDLPAGKSHIKGQQALAFVRQRHGLPRGDLDRIQRQQQFLGALLRRATSLGVLLNPFKLKSFLDVATKSVQVDDRLGFDDMKSLALAMKGLDPGRVAFVTAPVDRLAMRNGQSVVLLDEVAGRDMYQAIAHDQPLTKPPAPVPAKLTVAPRDVRVNVLNGTGVPRRAAGAANDLRDVGFRVVGTGNADGSSYERTTVRYAPGNEAAAATLVAALHGAKAEPGPAAPGTLTLIVGRDYQKPLAVKVTSSSPPPAPRPTASRPPVATAADDPCAA
ncbi:MAG TPA: LCP family protein [Mycobacteriales bacterium]|nr:LCP family protein [Mycobacteriales bacterium]